jgi:hypothetical protein
VLEHERVVLDEVLCKMVDLMEREAHAPASGGVASSS